MTTKTNIRRYLCRMDTRQVGNLFTDCLVIGGGVAGLRTALAAAEAGTVRVLAKDAVTESNTYYAQGGIAAVLRDEDSIEAHIQDTLQTGCGICDENAVRTVVSQAPQQINELRQWGAPFDMDGSRLAVGREGGHSHARIVHALGDATGKALANTLLERVRQNRQIKIFEQCFAIDLLTENNTCLGALTWHPRHGYQCIWARRTILASGGAGRLWRETTNPEGATADGLAMAYRAGAVLADVEFMQFHPTTLYVAGASRMLITEALRGAGAYLVDGRGERFMQNYHEMAELAPRDVVSRAIGEHLSQTGATSAFLDIRHLGSEWLARRFPTVNEVCRSFDINVDTDLIPIRPSAHYMVGGVRTDLKGCTSIDNLYACGEAAVTGLHGANRLASNSLLEGLVFGKICGEAAARDISENPGEIEHRTMRIDIPESDRTRLDLPDVTNSLRAVMWRNVGIVRNGQRLTETLDIIDFMRRYVADKVFDEPVGWQVQNMLLICRLIADAALQRAESRGVHYRVDFPEADDTQFRRHLEYRRQPEE
ncbi:MAG: L-aspartate oxidase [Sedimentisphaerales bacterium]|nr:L-aspartate oxidase [Sedimentisphaerales bacterium]